MLTFFEKQIYFTLMIIFLSYTNIKKTIITNKKMKNILFFTSSFFFDYLLNMKFASNGLIYWLISYTNLNKQFISFIILYIFYLNNFNSLVIYLFNYLLINSFLYK
jgi:hypothetical protein